MSVVPSKFEIKLNTKYEDTVVCDELEEDKLIFQQFDEELSDVYIVLNGQQVKGSIVDLNRVVSMLYESYLDSVK